VRRAWRVGAPADEDRAFVRTLGRKTALASVASQRPAPANMVRAAFDRLVDLVENQSHVTFIAENDGKRAGFLLFLDTVPDDVTATAQGFVAYMAVDPRRRGGGVGAALLTAAENEARRRGLPYMALMVTEENDAARRLYERSGYRTERRLLCKTL